jgi:hypothetical protein
LRDYLEVKGGEFTFAVHEEEDIVAESDIRRICLGADAVLFQQPTAAAPL